MTDYILEWCGIDSHTHTLLLNAERRAQEARTRAYLPLYWQTCIDIEFERRYACFWPEQRMAA